MRMVASTTRSDNAKIASSIVAGTVGHGVVWGAGVVVCGIGSHQNFWRLAPPDTLPPQRPPLAVPAPSPVVDSQCGDVPAGHVKFGVTVVVCDWVVAGGVCSPPSTEARSDDEIEERADTVAIDLGITASLLGCDEPWCTAQTNHNSSQLLAHRRVPRVRR